MLHSLSVATSGITNDYHSGQIAGHFLSDRSYNALRYKNRVYTDAMRYCKNCAEYFHS